MTSKIQVFAIGLMVLALLTCEDQSVSWTDPNPAGGPTPVVASIAPDSGFAGELVTITGENFSSTPEKNIVLFGKVGAIVTAATSTELTVQLPMVNDKTVIPRVAVHGAEFWGYWEAAVTDTNDNPALDTLEFTFYQSIFALTDTVYWPAGITTGPDSTVYFVVNQSAAGWSKGLHSITSDGTLSTVRTSSVLGNLFYNTDTDSIWGSNLRRGRDLGWISAINSDGSHSFSKMIKDAVTPSSIEFDAMTGDMYYSSLGYYELIITPVEDQFDTTVVDIPGGIYLEPMSGRTFSDTTLGIRVGTYSRPTSCKIVDGYLYVTQAGNSNGVAISRNLITGNTLGENEAVLDEFDDIYCLEFDSDGNMYFVPDGESTLYRYSMDSGEIVSFFPGDIVPTANYMAWDGDYLLLSHSNVPDDFEITSATDPGMIQRVYVGATGYQQ